MRVRKSRNLIILFTCLGLGSATGWTENASHDRSVRDITVQGNGHISAVPDQARLWVRVSEDGSRVETVTQAVRVKMDAVLKVLKAQGIAEKDIQTQAYQLSPKTEWKNGRSVRAGYTASNQVEVKLHDLKKVGSVLTAVGDAGANDINGPQFEFENPQELERKALALALQDAKAKAVLLAETAGASLGPVQTIQEGSVSRPGPRPLMAFKAMAPMAASMPSEEPIATGENTVEGNVTATFELK